jgi:hypothetical protein
MGAPRVLIFVADTLDAGSLAEIFVGRSATKWLRLNG